MMSQNKKEMYKLKKIIPIQDRSKNFVSDQEKVICFNKAFSTCQLYNLTLCKLIRNLELNKLPQIMKIIDKNRLMVGISIGDILIFEISTVKLLKTLHGHCYQVAQIKSFSDQYMISLCQNKEARIWNYKNFQQLFKINHQIAVKQISFSQDGQQVIVIAYDGSVKIHSTQTGEFINQINHNIQQVYFIKFLQQIDQCLIAYQNKQEKYFLLWDIKDYSNKQILQGFSNKIKYIYFNPKNFDLVIALTNSSKIFIYNLQTEEMKAEIEGLVNEQIQVEFTINNHLIISDQEDLLVYSDKGKLQQQLNTFNKKKVKYIKVYTNQNHIDSRTTLQTNEQKITQNEQTDHNEIWVLAPSYFAAIR